jgi:hypothetical protein
MRVCRCGGAHGFVRNEVVRRTAERIPGDLLKLDGVARVTAMTESSSQDGLANAIARDERLNLQPNNV